MNRKFGNFNMRQSMVKIITRKKKKVKKQDCQNQQYKYQGN